MLTGKASRLSPIGIELGAGSLRMVQLARSVAGWKLQAAAWADLGPQEQEVPADRIRWLLSSQPFRGRQAVAAMADKLLDAVPLRLSLEAGEDLEAANYLSYPLAEAVIDYCVFEDQRSSGKGLVRVLVFAARREQVDRYLSALGAAGLRPLAIDASAFALQRLCRWCGPNGAGKVLLLGLGRQESSLVVLWNHEVFLQRIIPWGLEAMTAAFVASLGLSEELARKMLSRFDFAPGRGEKDQETIAQVGSLELRKLVAEIERVLLYCASEMRGEVIDEIALAGDCQAIRGLGGYLHQALGVPTRILQPFNGQESRRRLPKSLLGKEASLAVACGLALRGSSEADG